jgi:hypothetical protein
VIATSTDGGSNKESHMKNLALMFGLVFTFAAAPLLAQQPDASKIRASLAQNQETLREYMWQSRVMVAVDGEEQKVDLYQVRYNLAGDLEKTRLGGEAQEMKRPRGPLRKRVAKNKKEGAAEFAESLKMTVMFQKLPGGPNYPARQVVDTQLGDKNLVITTENFDYVKPRG